MSRCVSSRPHAVQDAQPALNDANLQHLETPSFVDVCLMTCCVAGRQEFTAVYAVSRHPLDYDVKRTKHIRLDLTDKEAIKQVYISAAGIASPQ